MVKVVRGDIVLCDLNPVVGTEQSGTRRSVKNKLLHKYEP